MGVNTQLFISSEYELNEVKDVIERLFETKVEVRATHVPDYHIFDFKVGEEERNMSVFSHSYHYGFRGTLLDVNHWGRANEIMRAIGGIFGGFFREADCDENWEAITGILSPSDGHMFWARLAIINGVDHKDINKLKEFIENETSKWNKNIKHGF